jgi:propanol-preferring alcohol dehydrogenase
VVVTAYTKEAYETAPSLLRPKGTMVVVGLPHDASVRAGAAPLDFVLNQLNIVGSVVGTVKDVEEALDFTARNLVHVSCSPGRTLTTYRTNMLTLKPQPVLTKGTLGEVDKYAQRMLAGDQPGRVVLKVS